MKIALLHYHLKTGGVAAVVRQQATVLADACRVCVIAGEADGQPLPPNTCIIPDLAYTRDIRDPEATADAVCKAMNQIFRGPCDVLHVHNPTLVKNVNLLKILSALQHRGIRLLLQIHDFAEDGRPQDYSTDPYPHNAHYAVINSRDRRLLAQSGALSAGLHLLPNMVSGNAASGTAGPEENRVLYPVRAIGRKNIGEAILLSLYMAPRDRLGITLPPNSRADQPGYRSWKKFAARHHLKIDFDLGCRSSFDVLMGTAKYVITTSITEGFGFSFLEPWVYGKALLGRKLSAICRDFEACGINLSHLYTRLRIPLSWLDQNKFYQDWSDHLRRAARRYETRIPEHRLRTSFETLTAAGSLDFALLDVAAQQLVIERLLKNRCLQERLQAYNPFLRYFADNPVSDEQIIVNQQAIHRQYSASDYRHRLLEIYAAVKENAVVHRIDKRRLLDAFLRPPAVSLLSWNFEGG